MTRSLKARDNSEFYNFYRSVKKTNTKKLITAGYVAKVEPRINALKIITEYTAK